MTGRLNLPVCLELDENSLMHDQGNEQRRVKSADWVLNYVMMLDAQKNRRGEIGGFNWLEIKDMRLSC